MWSSFRVSLFSQATSIVAFRGLRRRHATHQTVIAAWSTTAGHQATPIGCDRMPATPRMTTAPRLYSTIALLTPRAAQLSASDRASQQATPSANSAAPASGRGESCRRRSLAPAFQSVCCRFARAGPVSERFDRGKCAQGIAALAKAAPLSSRIGCGWAVSLWLWRLLLLRLCLPPPSSATGRV